MSEAVNTEELLIKLEEIEGDYEQEYYVPGVIKEIKQWINKNSFEI